MTTTPPPPVRIRTPPTPLHGPKYDVYEPYSPRRSSRISSKQDQRYSQADMRSSAGQHPQSRADSFLASSYSSRKTPMKKASFKRTTSQTFSPPSSPIGPDQVPKSPRNPRVAANQSLKNHYHPGDIDSDFEMLGQVQPFSNRKLGQDGIPTPAKTPRKRIAYDEAQLSSTARVLFPARSAHTEEIMPSPRKSRKHKLAALGLDSFEEDKGADAFAIYTDSKERIPEADESEDNPFLSKRSSRRGQKSKTSRAQTGPKHGMTKQIDEAVESGKGMVYVFRGKKFYRPFTDDELASGQDDELGNASDAELHRQAGPPTERYPSRRSNPRRRLFQPEPSPQIDNVDEEAVTDIELDLEASARAIPKARTPTKHSFEPFTPPTTGRRTRTKNSDEDDTQLHSSPMWLDGAHDGAERNKKMTLFDTWQRTKPGAGKRALDITSSEEAPGKRSRSGQHASR